MYNHLQRNASTGHLCMGSLGHLSADCGPVPETCITDLPERYRLFEIELLASCPLCTPAPGGRQWDGTFKKVSPTACVWFPQNEDGYGASMEETLRIGPGILAITSIELITGADPHWSINIHCQAGENIEPLWFGHKNSGQTPLGKYTRMLGWLSNSTLTIH